MSKKLTIGLFALLFIVSGVQSLAISRIQKIQEAGNTNVVSLINSTKQSDKNQQAAVNLYSEITTDPDSPSPDPEEYIIYRDRYNNTHCAYMRNGRLYTGGSVEWDANANPSDINSELGCNGATAGYPTEIIIYNLPSGELSISGDPTQVMQLKLFLAGYLDIKQLTGKLDKSTSNAIISFQKSEGLPMTGVFETKTQIALDTMVFFTDRVLKKIGYKGVEPEGYFLYQNSAGVTLCGYTKDDGRLYTGGSPDGAGNTSIWSSDVCIGASPL